MGASAWVRGAVAALIMGAAAVSDRARAETMTFDAGCWRGDRIVVAGVGDLLFHNRLQRFALDGRQGYRPFWAPVEPLLAGADLTYGNLEAPTAPGLAAGGRPARDPGLRLDRVVYGYRPPFLAFNFHPSVLKELRDSGFDILSTANNHSMDRGALGVDRTIDELEAVGLPWSGTRRRAEADPAQWPRRWSARLASGGVTVSFIGCTTFRNGWPDPHDQVLMCQSDASMAEIRHEAADPDVDAVIVTPHWGWEDVHRPNPRQRELGRAMIDAGADVVLGAHPHVLQPWETRRAPDGREGLIVYSTGNFISNQRRPPQRTGAVVLMEFTRPKGADRAALTAAGYVPTWVEITGRGAAVTEAASGYGLRHAASIYPAGNRVRAAAFRDLPRPSCAVQGLPTDGRAPARAARTALDAPVEIRWTEW